MALMDGIETLREIRTMENGATIPVILLTSQKSRETVIEGTKLGILDYVLKPFDSQDLHARIDRALKKVGVLPVEETELYERVKAVMNELFANNPRNAILKIDEILSFKIDDEMFGRMQSAKSKIQSNDMDMAKRLVARVLTMLERNVKVEDSAKFPISTGEINARLLYVLNDLENFKVKDAAQKLEELLRYDIPEMVEGICMEAQHCLDDFDDGTAEKLIQKALVEMKEHLLK